MLAAKLAEACDWKNLCCFCKCKKAPKEVATWTKFGFALEEIGFFVEADVIEPDFGPDLETLTNLLNL
jgi:hypothetical protein